MTWTPQEMVDAERDKRVKVLQDKILELIRDNSIPPEEVCSALAGCALYMISLNTDKLRDAEQAIGIMKREMRTTLIKLWPYFQNIRKGIENGKEQLHRETSPEQSGSEGLERREVKETGKGIPG